MSDRRGRGQGNGPGRGRGAAGRNGHVGGRGRIISHGTGGHIRGNLGGPGFRSSDRRVAREKDEEHKENKDGRKHLGFWKLHALLTTAESNTDAVIMNVHRNLVEWEELLNDKSMSDDLFLIIIHLLGEKVCEDTVLKSNQGEIVRRVFGEGFTAKFGELCRQLMSSDDNVPRGRSTVEVNRSRRKILRNLHTLFSFVTLRFPTTAVDEVLGHVVSIFGVISYCMRHPDSGLELLSVEYNTLLALIESLKKKQEEKEIVQKRIDRYGLTPKEEEALHEMTPPEEFREIVIIPTTDEILSLEEPFLRPNKKSGAYASADHYLDVQFRLLREDFVQPLKRGVHDFIRHRHEYLAKKKKMPIGNVRIYPSVKVTNVKLVRDMMQYSIQLTEDIYKKVRWDKSKRLLPGSLLVLTADNFRSAYFGVVARRDPKELMKGEFGVTWEGNIPEIGRVTSYLMVECEVYFEAYRHTLQILQELELDKFPMRKFIVEGSTDVCAPKYLKDTENLMLIGGNYFSPLAGPWPNAKSLGLDDNQFNAFHAALTKEFVIIQGPPGTGKTFLGLKITEVFLQNLEAWWDGTGPILVVCFTNHALDQFLEGILGIMKKLNPDDTPAMIRVGGRSKTQALDEFSLIRKRMVASQLRQFDRDYAAAKTRAHRCVRDLEYDRAEVMNQVAGLLNPEGVLDFTSLGVSVYKKLREEFPAVLLELMKSPDWYGLLAWIFEKPNFSEERLLETWFKVREQPSYFETRNRTDQINRNTDNQPENEAEHNSEDEEDYDLDELLEHRIFDTLQMELENNVPTLNSSAENALRYLTGTSLKKLDDQLMKNKFEIPAQIDADEKLEPAHKRLRKTELEEQSRVLENRYKFMKLLFDSYREGYLQLPEVEPLLNPPHIIDNESTYFRNMSLEQKWAIYFCIIERGRVLKCLEVKSIQDELIQSQKTYQEIIRQGDGQLLQKTKVVGMTTTGAAKYNDLLRMMKSKIVIVEEAAEVLESHIVTCISKHCEHLILIGDHQQLRPSTTVYDLSVKYNLDISLFERMLNNNLNCYKLKVQHRMRPEICNLIVDTIYTELENHASVRFYPEVEGLVKNLFFITHTRLEKSENDSMSKSNEYEAKFLAQFTRYLILQGYSPDQITVLTTYTGQMFLLKNEMRALESCRGVRVTVVDNFQGEENDIILLSLVRSNEANQIGFLKTDNRICVAISRAKHGLFIIGNMEMLSSKSKTWQKIKVKLDERFECGQKLELKCQIHGVVTEVENPQDFKKVPEGGCSQMCYTDLPCGHPCKSVCHTQDRNHTEYKCREHCRKTCPNQHLCASVCFQPCPPCPSLMDKTLPCGHIKKLRCHIPESSVICTVQVPRHLPCGHVAEMACHKDVLQYSCKVKVTKILRCLHEKPNVECYVDPDIELCKIMVLKNLPCGHAQSTRCHILPEMIKCETMVKKTFQDCDHEMDVKCYEVKSSKVYCKAACSVRLLCGHACTKTCHVGQDPNHLEYTCRKECGRTCPNGHSCKTRHKCFQQPCPPCLEPVEKKLDCGTHTATVECWVDVKDINCEFPCELQLPLCGHACQNLCFQPCEPCHVLVEKKSPCGHDQKVECYLPAQKERCEVMVSPSIRSACGHNTRVPCKIQNTVEPEEAMEYCQHPCNFKFVSGDGTEGCGHDCKGTCSECCQGRLHKKCQEECGRSLVCGHRCSFPCAKTCPPCRQKCELKCDHSQCMQRCGEPCTGCNEDCSWQCEHKVCKKRCREPCDRSPCELPCPKKIAKCGHGCIGFCGELCPTLCLICDKEELTEVFFGDEDEPDARFVQLKDCNHCFESRGLDKFMMQEVEKAAIQAKVCPKCKTIIRHSRRYGNILQSQIKDVLRVKMQIFGNAGKVFRQQQNVFFDVTQNSAAWGNVLPQVRDFILDKLAFPTKTSQGKAQGAKKDRTNFKPIDEFTMASVELIANYGKDAIKELQHNPSASLTDALWKDLWNHYTDLLTRLMSRTLPLSNAEIKDFDREFERLFDLKQVYMRKSSPRFTNQHAVATPLYNQVTAIVFSPKVYTKEMKARIVALLKEIDEAIKTGLGISDRERREILSAFGGMAQGHWFKCPKGHIYLIDGCGGAMEESKCSECDARIGGGNHALRRDNQLAGEMDGATRPLWPNTLDR